jgi:hypothetical protein
MRSTLVAGLVSGLFFGRIAMPQSLSNGTASVAGVITGAEAPIVVYLQSEDENPTRYYDGYQANGDKNGKFSFEEIKPGIYHIWAKATGFISVGSGDDNGIKITLRPNEHRTGVTIPMVHRRALCGSVTEGGTPKPTWVSSYRYDSIRGTLIRTFLPNTNEDGSYRFADLDPGTYYLQAYMTWYPGSFSFNDAKPVTVGRESGPTTCSLDIPLQYTGCRAFKVHGKIATSPSAENQQFRVVFLERNPNGGSVPTVVGTLNDLYKSGESFTSNVCSGDYDVALTDSRGTGYWGDSKPYKVVFDSQTVSVGSSDVDGVLLTPQPMASVTGQVHFEGINRHDSCPGIGGQTVDILRTGDAQFQSATLDDKNRFEFHNVAPGEYTLTLGLFQREAVYIKSITVDGKPAEGRTVVIPKAGPVAIEITLSGGDLSHAAGHLSPDLRREHRWEVAWTRPKGSVSGTVHGDALGGYAVKLRSARFSSNASAEYTVRTASDGTFHFDAVDPGVYTLRAESNNTLTSEYGALAPGLRGTPIVVNRGSHLTNLTFSPPTFGSICGRVTDPNGAPHAGMRVFVEALQFGGLLGSDKNEDLTTDSDGHFRAKALIPGDYFLAFPWRDRVAYFSRDGSLNGATPVHLRVGESAGCAGDKPLELRAPDGLDRLYSISGKVTGDLPKRVGDRFWINLLWDVPRLGSAGLAGTAKLDENHEFHLEHVPNGRFVLQLFSAYGPEPMTWSGPYGPVSHLLASKSLVVRDEDVRNVEILPISPPSVTGTVRFEHFPGAGKNFDVSTQTITLAPREYRAPVSAKLSADGSFTIDAEDVGEYEVQISPYGVPPHYIQSVRLDGREVASRYFQVEPNQAAHLEVVVSGDPGQVYSTLTPDPSLPLPEPSVSETCGSRHWPQYQLVFIPDPLRTSDPMVSLPRFYGGGPAGDINQPLLQALEVPPGRYRAVAAEHFPSQYGSFGPPNLSAETRARLWTAIAQLGEPVTVRAGERIELALPDKTIDVARLAAKLGLPFEDGR